jgi:hypothetical protein
MSFSIHTNIIHEVDSVFNFGSNPYKWEFLVKVFYIENLDT